MIQTRGAIELRDDRGQFSAEAPLVGAAAGTLDFTTPFIPPARYHAANWLDDEHAIAAAG